MTTFLVLTALFVGATAISYRQHRVAGIRQGLGVSWRMFQVVAPNMAIGMLLAGMAQVVLPAELISRWMGNESGLTGVLIGTVVGSVVPGGPYVVVPLIGSVYHTGAGPGAIAAFVSAWSLSPITRTVMFEIPFLGGALTAARLIVSTPASIAIGLLTIPIYDLLFG
jgi:uncharacterized membrane protein YraQ (UPF0718 family)